MFKLFDEESWLPVPPPLRVPGGELSVPRVLWVLLWGSGQLLPFPGGISRPSFL